MLIMAINTAIIYLILSAPMLDTMVKVRARARVHVCACVGAHTHVFRQSCVMVPACGQVVARVRARCSLR
jgi:hypothetical protein